MAGAARSEGGWRGSGATNLHRVCAFSGSDSLSSSTGGPAAAGGRLLADTAAGSGRGWPQLALLLTMRCCCCCRRCSCSCSCSSAAEGCREMIAPGVGPGWDAAWAAPEGLGGESAFGCATARSFRSLFIFRSEEMGSACNCTSPSLLLLSIALTYNLPSLAAWLLGVRLGLKRGLA
jgi:hypothetical protein